MSDSPSVHDPLVTPPSSRTVTVVRNDDPEIVVAQPVITWWRDAKFQNILLLGFSFMALFSAFQTCGLIQTIVLQSFFGPDASTLGYNSLGVLYAAFGIANWFSPFIVSLIGPKWGMVAGGACYTLFIAVFLHPFYGTLYAGSVLVGIGAAVLWTAQGVFLTINSDKTTMARNSGLFWALFQSSFVWGNLFFFFYLGGAATIEDHSRFVVYIVLLILSAVGLLVMFAFRHPVKAVVVTSDEVVAEPRRSRNPLTAIAAAFRMLKGRDMLLLSITFAYTGFEQTFYSGVYGTSLGYTKQFGDIRKSIVGLSGVFIGVGQITGGLLFGILGKKTIRHGRDPIVLFGFMVHIITFFLIFLNIPFDAPLRDSQFAAFIQPNIYLGVFCCFLLGLGDASFNTQVYSLLGSVFRADSASAFALFKFVQSICAAGAFYYSSALFLQYQLLILLVMGTLGTFCFCFVEWRHAADDDLETKE
ncbi:UNC93-like protein MFSD11 isoform X2 [Paramacrobiotus metropolitanus]|nr:UNC93-like protein MFSD11 isoform X2 [Paramacrobiotus metropolitanus]